ncbi:alpha/beta fold hydrolase [Streptomyces sp. NPDC005533]|uniref:alpha/beta fold hydrolase n=1 Tax=Streptomyces sp. NPDC005533 TaxID=3364723 RepID=UPI0036B71188
MPAAPVITTDHPVPHVSQLPVNKGETINLFVRERDGTQNPAERTAVLMLHGRSIPVLPGADLGTGKYNWMMFLADAGYDVFAMDLQGHGRSYRPPVMDDPRNANPKHQGIVHNGHPLPGPGPDPVQDPRQLGDSRSDVSEVHTVVEFIKKRHNLKKVTLMGWSAAAQAFGPYAIRYPENVSSLFLLAPVFPPDGPAALSGTDWDPPVELPRSTPAETWGFPMNLLSRKGFGDAWAKELGCPGQRDDDIEDKVWAAIMESDTLGRTWGPPTASGAPQGVLRYRNPFWWGWNKTGAKLHGVLGDKVPVLIAYGERDQTVQSPAGTVPFLSVTELYKTIPGAKKLMFKVACAGHQIPWERASKHVHHLSREWLKHTAIEGHTQGSFLMDKEGNITPAP